MASNPAPDVTELLMAWGNGDQEALERLLPLVYDQLRRLARGRLRHERSQHTLQTTALVHEAFVRLVDQRSAGWESRGHFFAIAAQMMRRVLVDYARRQKGQRRGGGFRRVTLEGVSFAAEEEPPDVLVVHDALEALATRDPRRAKMVELRFFGGLSIEETAEALQVSPGTVMRDWTLAKAWLQREIRGAPAA